MKKYLGLLAGFIAVTICNISWAELAETRNEWTFGPEAYYFNYEEPDLGVEFEGPMVGLGGSFTHHNRNKLMLKVEGRGAYGEVDYTGSGTINGVEDYMFEGRIAAGYDLAVGENGLLTPFFGVGYRYLNDDSSGKVSSTGAAGYERESNYFYSPVGVEYSTQLNDGWRIGVGAEYDIFWGGEQKSHLEDASPAFNTVTNDQESGYGARGSLKFQKAGEKIDVLIEPYVRWWSIKDSESANVTFAGTIIGTGYEPKNETLEAGAQLAIKF